MNNQRKTPFAYNGEVRNVTGLDYLRARYYDSQADTFLTEDSYQDDLTDPLSQNRYTYAQNNPVNYTDPSGHFIKGLIAGAKGLYQKAKSAVSNAWEKAQNLISSGVSVAKKVASKVAGYVGTVAKPLAVHTKTAYTSNVNTGLSALTTVVQSVAQGMGQIASSAVHYVSLQQQDAVWTTTNAWLQAKASGESDYNWQGAKIREAANIFRNWTSALEQTVKHVCEVANRAASGQDETKLVDFTGNRLVEQERLQQALETIKASSEDEIEKTKQIVKAYEDYLYLSNKEAFDEYWKVRKNYNGDWKPENTYVDDVEKALGEKI